MYIERQVPVAKRSSGAAGACDAFVAIEFVRAGAGRQTNAIVRTGVSETRLSPRAGLTHGSADLRICVCRLGRLGPTVGDEKGAHASRAPALLCLGRGVTGPAGRSGLGWRSRLAEGAPLASDQNASVRVSGHPGYPRFVGVNAQSWPVPCSAGAPLSCEGSFPHLVVTPLAELHSGLDYGPPPKDCADAVVTGPPRDLIGPLPAQQATPRCRASRAGPRQTPAGPAGPAGRRSRS